jgi:hypothetical protein
VLINNAAQTLTRQKGWNVRMTELESTAAGTPDLERAEMTRGRSRVSHSQKNSEKILEKLFVL